MERHPQQRVHRVPQFKQDVPSDGGKILRLARIAEGIALFGLAALAFSLIVLFGTSRGLDVYPTTKNPWFFISYYLFFISSICAILFGTGCYIAARRAKPRAEGAMNWARAAAVLGVVEFLVGIFIVFALSILVAL